MPVPTSSLPAVPAASGSGIATTTAPIGTPAAHSARARSLTTAPPIYVNPPATVLGNATLAARHAAWWLLPVLIALIALRAFVRWVARRRGLPLPSPPQLRGAVLGGLAIGGLAQETFVLLTDMAHWTPGGVRLLVLVVTGFLTGLLAAQFVPYMCRWRAMALGALAALPMSVLYARWVSSGLPFSHPSAWASDAWARGAMGLILAGFIALAVRFPVAALEWVFYCPPDGGRQPHKDAIDVGAHTVDDAGFTVSVDRPRVG